MTVKLARRIAADARSLERRMTVQEKCANFVVSLESAIYAGEVELPRAWLEALVEALRDD